MECSHPNEKYFLMRRKIMSGTYGKYLDYLQNMPIYVVDTIQSFE